jgi:hypothetical protein
MKSDYIIDLERINQLTSSQYDDPKGINQPLNQPYSLHSISKNIIKQCIEIYFNKDSRHSDKSKLIEAIETLEYNKILISKSTIRDTKINDIIE